MNNNGQLTSPSVTIDLHPSAANPRGGYGVAGLLIDDLLPGTSYPGDELIVTTLSGDLFVYSLSGTLLFHTFVPGALGMYNSIIAKDLNGDHTKELYIAGSYGLFRFVQPGETHP